MDFVVVGVDSCCRMLPSERDATRKYALLSQPATSNDVSGMVACSKQKHALRTGVRGLVLNKIMWLGVV